MEVEDAQAAALEAQAHPRQGPAVPAELSTGSGAHASSTSKREIESRELGDMGTFDMDVESENRGGRIEDQEHKLLSSWR